MAVPDWSDSPRCKMRVQAAMAPPELEPSQSGQSSESSALAGKDQAASAINTTKAKRMIASLGRSQIAHALKV
jgi:hypothetical protein